MDQQQVNALIQQILTTSASLQALTGYIPPMFGPYVNSLLDWQNRLLAPKVVQTFIQPPPVSFPIEQWSAARTQWNTSHEQWIGYLQTLLNHLQSNLKYAESEVLVRQMTGTFGPFQDFQRTSADQWTNLWESHKRVQSGLDRNWIDILGGHGCSVCDVQPCPCLCFPSVIQGALCTKCGHLGH